MKFFTSSIAVFLVTSSVTAVEQAQIRSVRGLKKDKKAPVPTPPAPTPAKPTEMLKTKCPSAITLTHPGGPGRIGDKCLAGAACQTRFDPGRRGSSELVGVDSLSVKGQQQATLLAKSDKLFDYYGFDLGPIQSFIPDFVASEALGGRGSFGFIYFDSIVKCLERGPAAIHYDFDLNTSPFQAELVELCQCILSGGIQCDTACGCHNGLAFPQLPGGVPFCDCYCACCH